MSELKTVFVTGATGYIAKHIVLQLLEAGYAVKGSVRSESKANEMKSALAEKLSPAALARLETVKLDLTSDEGWGEALNGADVLLHTASPFPIVEPKHPDELIRPAVDGTLRALNAARDAGITRVVLTSSSAAIMGTELQGRDTYNESDWTDMDRPNTLSYVKSKTMAEQAAWDFIEKHPEMQLTTINPVFVMGPGVDANFGSSLEVIQRLVQGKDPAMPKLSFPIVDVRDIALMHIRAMERDAAIGRRFIGSSETLWFKDIAETMKDALPNRKIVTRVAPNWLIRVIALFDKTIRTIVPDLGKEVKVDASAAREVLGIDFIPARTAVADSATFIESNGYY